MDNERSEYWWLCYQEKPRSEWGGSRIVMTRVRGRESDMEHQANKLLDESGIKSISVRGENPPNIIQVITSLDEINSERKK